MMGTGMNTDLVHKLKAFNADRNPELVQIKYQAMRVNSFAFLRGTCHLFYDDESGITSLNAAPLAWICGDLHPNNFGSYKAENRLAYFDVNDFDEAVLAPCTWDPARFLTAILVGAPLVQANQTQADALAELFLRTYAERLTQGYIRAIERETATGLVKDLLQSVSGRRRPEFLDAHAPWKGKRRRLKVDGTHYLPVTDVERATVTSAIRELQPLADRVDLTAWGGKVQLLEKFVYTAADVLAWGQLRTSGRQGSATADELIIFASVPGWQSQLIEYAKRSAARVEADFEVFSQAYDLGQMQDA